MRVDNTCPAAIESTAAHPNVFPRHYTCLLHLHQLTGFPTVPHPNQLPPWSRVFPEKITGPQVAKKFHAFCGTRSFHYCIPKCPPPITFLFNQRISPSPRPREIFRDILSFYAEELAPRPTTKLEDHTLSAVRDCLLA